MRTQLRLAVTLSTSLALAPACAVEGMEEDPELDVAYGVEDDYDDPSLVIAWNQVAVDTAFAVSNPPGFIGLENLRGWTIMHLAMHDALNSIDREYARYAFFGRDGWAHPIAAGAQAAHDVLVNIYPSEQANLDAELAAWLDTVPDGSSKTRGISLGRQSAAANIAARANDNMLVFGSYTPVDPPVPGRYQFVPPLAFLYRPAFGDATPFALDSGAQFRPPAPPALTSSTYAAAYNEVKAKGALTGSTRTTDQTNLAFYWLEFSEVGWNHTARITAPGRLDLWEAAQTFALMNVAIADASIVIWNAKRHYDFWRPYTAIRAGDTDGNPSTAPDTSWLPLNDTPPIWEYPSAHAIQSAAAAKILAMAYETDYVSFTRTSASGLPGAQTRSYNRLSQAASEAADSRVMTGFHFRFATNTGLSMGRLVANEVEDEVLEEIDD